MLVLGRREGEAVVITAGEYEIRISVESFRGPAVRLGFQADRDVLILREELTEDRERRD